MDLWSNGNDAKYSFCTLTFVPHPNYAEIVGGRPKIHVGGCVGGLVCAKKSKKVPT